MHKLKTIKITPGKGPELIYCDSHLSALENLVEGHVETLCIICNQDAIFPPPFGAGAVPLHPILLCGMDFADGIDDSPVSVIPENILRVFKEATNEWQE